MSYEINPDYTQACLFPQKLGDWIPLHHKVRFIREFVETLDLDALGFKVRRVRNGRPNYGAKLLLMVWLYGYFEKIYSLRGLESACQTHVPLMWLISKEEPSYSSIRRFFVDNKDKIEKLFRNTVRIAYKNNLVGLVIQAIDGTKIAADVSKNRSLHRNDLKKLMAYLDEMVGEVVSKMEANCKEEVCYNDEQLPPHLQDKRKLQKIIKKGLEELDAQEQVKLKKAVEKQLEVMDEKGLNHLSLTDPDAALIKIESKNVCEYSYNAQAVVDAQNQIITGAKVSTAASDNSHLTMMIDESKENTGQECQETVADGGYFSGEELKKAEEEENSVLVNASKRLRGRDKDGHPLPFHKRKFKYDEERDAYICPSGESLQFEREKKNSRSGQRVRIYRCHCRKSCDFFSLCSSDKKGRTIERGAFEDAIENQLRRHGEEENRYLLTYRSAVVEPVFGWVKHNMGIRRWSYRGLDKVDAQWKLICTIINLKKLFKLWQGGELKFA